MREIVHLQAGQCGNQIGAKVCEQDLFNQVFGVYLRKLGTNYIAYSFLPSSFFLLPSSSFLPSFLLPSFLLPPSSFLPSFLPCFFSPSLPSFLVLGGDIRRTWHRFFWSLHWRIGSSVRESERLLQRS